MSLQARLKGAQITKCTLFAWICAFLCGVQVAQAQNLDTFVQDPENQTAMTPETQEEAVGHYARAQSLLGAAIREFDKGYALARPDAFLDSARWRDGLLNRAEELTPIIDPQPKDSYGGARFSPDTRLLDETSNDK